MVTLDHLLDNRQTQPGAACVRGITSAAYTTAVGAKKPLSESLDVTEGDADAVVGHPKFALASVQNSPMQSYAPTRRCVMYGVAGKIKQGRIQLRGVTMNKCRCPGIETDFVLSFRQRFGIGEHCFHQRGYRKMLILWWRIGFEYGEREQLVDQVLHPPRLGGRHLYIVRALCGRGVGGRIFQRFKKTQGHRQRSFEFMRNIGDEVAAHSRHTYQLGNVTYQ